MANNLIQGESLQNRVMKYIPLRIIWTAGTPTVASNVENESVTLTDNGAGDLTITFAVASLMPLLPLGSFIEVADANTLSLEVNLDGACTTTVMKIVINSGADGATETDPVAINLLIGKLVVA